MADAESEKPRELEARVSGSTEGRKPDISVVVVVYNIPREAPRTLFSLSTAHQRHIDPGDYEVIIVDNGSSPPFDPRVLEGLSGNFRLIRIEEALPSPAQAVNRGIAEARGEVIGVMIDGARIVTPGLLHFARHGARLYETAVVAALGWYLGYDFQRWATQSGYDQAREDALLGSIAWPQDGYRLFDIGTLDESSTEGWFQPVAEANALFMRRELWGLLGGVDERFNAPGGGLVNLDTFSRAMELPDAQLVILLGEGTFHQIHGGIATNLAPERVPDSWKGWAIQYENIRGRPYAKPKLESQPTYVGTLPRSAFTHFVRAAVAPVRREAEPPLGRDFDQGLWSRGRPYMPADPTIAAVVKLAQEELRAGRYDAALSVARLVRSRAPDEPEPQRILSLVACGLDQQQPPGADYHVALGEAHRLLGEKDIAIAKYRDALSLEPNLVQAHIGLATLRMPGDFYYTWLERFYSLLAPEAIIEIGIADGASLARVRPPTLAIGVDPSPRVAYPLTAETHIFPETSDTFFARGGPDKLLAGRPCDIGFIDGLHLFEQALKDFINLERYCGPRSVILFHDTVPLDEATESRARDTKFHTGDVWKVVPCLKHYRPDLDVFTIATPWTGLTVVTGLDPTSRVLEENFDEAVARFIDVPFADIQHRLDSAFNIVSNDWDVVAARLKAQGIL
jgi:tetratricopeptide (TPR) repeat protein